MFAANASKALKKSVKTVSKNGSETVTKISKTGTEVKTYDDNVLKIIDYGKIQFKWHLYWLN